MSMSFMSALDWTEFFESVSLVDEVLEGGSVQYAAMDFSTRDAYRHAIEDLSEGSRRSELDIAREAVRIASEICVFTNGNVVSEEIEAP